MENSNFIRQAKSDIFKELHPILSFYINKGAKPQALKKYYKNNKRFIEILEDIKNKGINLVKDENEYKKIVREVLNEILDDFIAKEKDDEYKNKQSKMKHIKEFNSYEPEDEPVNEIASWILSVAAGFFLYKFLRGLLKELKPSKLHRKFDEMTPQQRSEYQENLQKQLDSVNFKILSNFVTKFFREGGQVKFSENYLYYIFELGDLIIKIDKINKTIKWSKIEIVGIGAKYVIADKENFTNPLPITEEDINGLITSIKEEGLDKNNVKA
jgi:hypothetical protein